jgi:hypothetical protein
LIGKKVWHPGFSFLLQPLSTLLLLNGATAPESPKQLCWVIEACCKLSRLPPGRPSHNFSRNCSCFYPVVAVPYCQSKEYKLKGSQVPRTNYKFEKRQKELAKKKKKEEKRLRKQDKNETDAEENRLNDTDSEAVNSDEDPGIPEGIQKPPAQT